MFIFPTDHFHQNRPARRRVVLVARWQRDTDGYLRCRWVRSLPPDYR